MSKSLEELRQDLARDLGVYFTGVATGGAVGTVIDTAGLTHFGVNDSLIGALVYIYDTTDELAPEGESAWATDYVAATSTITVLPQFTVAVGAGDTYELYLSPLDLESWNQAINQAIRDAWPEVWGWRKVAIIPTNEGQYQFDANVEGVMAVYIRPQGDIADIWGFPSEPLVAGVNYVIHGIPGSSLKMEMLTPGALDMGRILVFYKFRHPELAEGESTALDYPYIMAAAKANAYQMLAAHSASQSGNASYLQLMNHWQTVAEARKAKLAAELLGISPLGGGRKP